MIGRVWKPKTAGEQEGERVRLDPPPPGADPGFRRGGGGFVHSEGGGGGVRTGISGADPNCCRALGKSTSNI